MSLYFDPVPLLGGTRTVFGGAWEDRMWLNVPGPIYGAQTDNCGTGRLHAPALALYEDEYLTEYVYRQPRNLAELGQLALAAAQGPYGAYACDGDEHWSPSSVRAWWRDRGRIVGHLRRHHHVWQERDERFGQGLVGAVRDHTDHTDGELAGHLRVHVFRLDEGRSPTPDDRLPEL